MKAIKKALKVSADGFWFAIVYTLIEHDDGGREMQLWAVRAENNEDAINEWLSKQPK